MKEDKALIEKYKQAERGQVRPLRYSFLFSYDFSFFVVRWFSVFRYLWYTPGSSAAVFVRSTDRPGRESLCTGPLIIHMKPEGNL
jgi:hypothetical protein